MEQAMDKLFQDARNGDEEARRIIVQIFTEVTHNLIMHSPASCIKPKRLQYVKRLLTNK